MNIVNGVLYDVVSKDIVDGKFIIPNGVTSIGSFAFFCCGKLTSIEIPDSVTSIGDSAFSGCSLTSIEIPDSVTSIGSEAFSSCKGLTSVVIPDSVTSIGDRAFYNCSGLISVVIGSGVTGIGSYAFECCKKLTSVVIGNSVKFIDECAFFNCILLQSKVGNYKAFNLVDGKLRCLDKEYFEDKVNTVDGELRLCKNGIHYCTNLFELFNYYGGEIDKNIAIYEIEVGDKILKERNCSKCCTNSIELKKRLFRDDIIKLLNVKSEVE